MPHKTEVVAALEGFVKLLTETPKSVRPMENIIGIHSLPPNCDFGYGTHGLRTRLYGNQLIEVTAIGAALLQRFTDCYGGRGIAYWQ